MNRGLGYTLLPESPLQAQVVQVSQGGITPYIDQDTGQVWVSGVVAGNGNSIPLTAQQYLDFMSRGILKVNNTVLPPQYIPGSDAGVFLGGVQQAPVVAGGNAPVTVSNPTMAPNNPALTPAAPPTTPQGQQIINSSGASSGAATPPPVSTDWFTESMFGGIPNWGLLAAAAVAAFFVMKGGK